VCEGCAQGQEREHAGDHDEGEGGEDEADVGELVAVSVAVAVRGQ
jgi:hypothetical protein